jgi:hypothetical protein
MGSWNDAMCGPSVVADLICPGRTYTARLFERRGRQWRLQMGCKLLIKGLKR